MKTFTEHKNTKILKGVDEVDLFLEYLYAELTEEETVLVNEALEGVDLKDIDEGLFSSLLGGISGAALGPKLGRAIAKALGVNKGIFYDMLTSRLVGAAIGATLAKSL
jgi:hypothetical protein